MTELWLKVILAIAITTYMLVRRSGQGQLPYIAAFLTLIGLGPVINYLMGEPIYVGVVLDYIPSAVNGYLLAIAGLFIADLMLKVEPAKASEETEEECDWGHRFGTLVCLFLVFASAYALAFVMVRGPALIGADKLQAIELAGPFHYRYLLLEICLAATYLLIRDNKAIQKVFWLNMGIYSTYCLLTSERDFVLVLLGVAVQSQNQRIKARLLGTVVFGAAAASLATLLFAYRGGASGGSFLASILGQGSILFVDTRVLSYVPTYEHYRWGQTYLDSMLTALSLGRLGSGSSLSQWLIDIYAPGSKSGYGFSMIAEIGMNFTQFAILPVFVLLGVSINSAVRRAKSTPLAAYMSTFFIVFVPYMLRSDSRGLLSGVVYALVFYGVLALFTSSERTKKNETARRR